MSKASATPGPNVVPVAKDTGKLDPGWIDLDDLGAGDVSGPASSTDGAVAIFDGTTGKLLKDGVVLGDCASLDVGTTAGTVAAGDHTHDDRYYTESEIDTELAALKLYIVSGSYGAEDDKPPASKTIFRHMFTDAASFPEGLTGSNFWAEVEATAETVFSIMKNTVQVGTATFAVSGTDATLAMASPTSFAAGDVLRIVSPAQDASLAGIAWALRATRS